MDVEIDGFLSLIYRQAASNGLPYMRLNALNIKPQKLGNKSL